jgi:hypothetical protein
MTVTPRLAGHARIVCHPAPARILRCVPARPLKGRVKNTAPCFALATNHNLTPRMRQINPTGKSLPIYGNHVKSLAQKYIASVYPKYTT